MPTAYDLSSVIAGGSSVGHNNLIPLGERLGSGSGGGQHPGQPWGLGLLRPVAGITFASSGRSWLRPSVPFLSASLCRRRACFLKPLG